MNYILKSSKPNTNASISDVGGKAYHLIQLVSLGMNVPEFKVINANWLSSHLTELKKDNFTELRNEIECFVFPPEMKNEILSSFHKEDYFSVRSSGINEDGADFSFAGQFETVLFVDANGLEKAIKKVWSSAFSERISNYCKKNNIEHKAEIAIIIQRMVNSEASGVGFGINPVSGNRSEKLISAVWGVGEGLVSGELDADTYKVSNEGKIETEICTKKEQLIFDSVNGGLKKESVTQDKQLKAALSHEHIIDLSLILDKLYQHYHKYQDIEFAVENNRLYLLQSRAITTLSKVPDESGNLILWDNSNIIESYPGLTSPLTFSFILKMYEAVYRQFAQLMGVSVKMIDEESHIYANMLGLINGRVYYNLLSWYQALAQLPGYSINAPFMEKMMGVKERFELENPIKENGFKAWWRVLKAFRTILKNHNTVKKQRDEFLDHFDKVMEEYDKMDFSKSSPEKLMKDYLYFEQTLVKKWKAPLVNDFFAMIYFGTLQKLSLKYKIDTTDTIHNDLVSGAGDIISTEPITLGLAIADAINLDNSCKELFLQKNEAEIWKSLKAGKFPEVKQQIDSYIKKWGDRCVGELKLETVTYTTKPELYIKILKSYIIQKLDSKTILSNAGKNTFRLDAEIKVEKALSGKFFKKLLFNFVLKKARYLVSNRENLRFERTRGFGMVRKMFIEMGNKFSAEGIIEKPEDIFYLTQQEIFDFIKGTSVNGNLKNLIQLRKSEYTIFDKQSLSERIRTKGMVYVGNEFTDKNKLDALLTGDLKGIPCCAGQVKAKVRIVNHPSEVDSLNGDILVTSSTDPGWVTLFPTCSAILVERGSLLSHSAIVSREMGIPCIVGITGLLQNLKTGDLVLIDGATGVIVKCEE